MRKTATRREAFADYVVHDLLSALPGVEARAMFGGHGLYLNGTIFGLIADETLYFKTDSTTRPDYASRGSRPFVYEAKGKPITISSYWEVPADVAEDREMVWEWVKIVTKIKNLGSAKTKQPKQATSEPFPQCKKGRASSMGIKSLSVESNL